MFQKMSMKWDLILSEWWSVTINIVNMVKVENVWFKVGEMAKWRTHTRRAASKD